MSLFEWDQQKALENEIKHGISFEEAKRVFLDPHRYIETDISHSSEKEQRYYCIGKVEDQIITVRFVYRNNKIRIFGAGYWRKGRKIYEKENQIH